MKVGEETCGPQEFPHCLHWGRGRSGQTKRQLGVDRDLNFRAQDSPHPPQR